MKPALIVIDIQKGFFSQSPDATASLRQALPVVNAAIALFRDKQLPIFCVQHSNPSVGIIPGAEGYDLPDELTIANSDPHVHKTYGNAFNKTNLGQLLDEQGVDTIFLAGFCAEFCVLSTYRGALDRDLTPVILRGALISRTPGNIPFVEAISEVVSLNALKKLLD
jgi:nicotinamidase-related amidase